jgi:D-alanine-D-alanine ligase
MTTVGLVFGGRSVEHRVSVASARNVARGLADAGHAVAPLGIGPDGGWVATATARAALDGAIDALPPGGRPVHATLAPLLESGADVLFPIVHGTWGEDGTLQGFCEMLDLPYVGAGVTASAIAMDKVFCKQVLASAGIPVVDAEVVTRAEVEADVAAALARCARLAPPIFVKPSVGGSSVGVTKVERREALGAAIADALRFDDRALVERGVVGRELECAVLGLETIEASAVGEIVPGKEFYDYADKYLDDGAKLLAPAPLDDDLAARVRRTAAAAFAAIGGWGMARVDFLLSRDGELFVNELNTLPGFTDISMYPRLWALSGLPLPALVGRLVAIAFERHADRARLDQGIKGWIAEVGK